MSAKLWELEERENNGSGNNVANPTWGQAGTPLLRGDTPALYGPGNAPRPYPDELGLLDDTDSAQEDLIDLVVRTEGGIGDPATNVPNSYGTNELSAFYGQFITHDMAASTIPIAFPGAPVERLFPGNTDPDMAGIVRSPSIIDGEGVRQQIDTVSHYLDLSMVYGSNDTVVNLLRGSDGKLVTGTSTDGGLPTVLDIKNAHPEIDPAAVVAGLGVFAFPGTNIDTVLVAGDGRATQQPMLAAIHTIWLKEHNYQVDQLAAKYPDLTGDELFNAARAITEAEYQNTVYQEYLASVIGKENVPQFTGYDETVNAGVLNSFTTVAFRFGHDQQSEVLQLIGVDGNIDLISLTGTFVTTTTQLTEAGGLEEVLRGLQVQKSQEVDGKLVPSLIDNVLGIPNLNLGLLDNVRAADHGIGTLNQVREQLGLDTYDSWADFQSQNEVAQDVIDLLEDYYGSINNLDPWLGGLLEKAVPGSQLGETFQMIVIAQFTASMAGDRFYYEERLKDFPELIAEMKGVTFAEITDRNSGTDHSHLASFHVANRMEFTSGSDVKYGADDADFLAADLMIGGGGNDSLYGRNGSDTLYGDAGNDRLDGGAGDDFLKMGVGNDIAYGGVGDDKAWGEDGDDQIHLDNGNDWADGGEGKDRITGGDGNDIALGKGGNDLIYGGDGEDDLFGGDGDDTVYGDADNDEVYGGAGNDKVAGGAGDDLVNGEDGNDLLYGDAGNDDVRGGDGNDEIRAGSGNDRVAGDAGNDKLFGDSGEDIFVFAEGSGQDTVWDFNVSQDKIDLFELEQFDTFAAVQAVMTTVAGKTTIDLGDTDGDGSNDTIALLGTGGATLTADNFILFEEEQVFA